jgi:hypothetical protein
VHRAGAGRRTERNGARARCAARRAGRQEPPRGLRRLLTSRDRARAPRRLLGRLLGRLLLRLAWRLRERAPCGATTLGAGLLSAERAASSGGRSLACSCGSPGLRERARRRRLRRGSCVGVLQRVRRSRRRAALGLSRGSLLRLPTLDVARPPRDLQARIGRSSALDVAVAAQRSSTSSSSAPSKITHPTRRSHTSRTITAPRLP